MMSALDRLHAALAGRYLIEREVGAGGMATVYVAEDLRHHRKVAIKVLRAELAATIGPDRFLQEIETVARLTHPHILPLHDSGEADGFLYYVMPYIAGESLRSRLARERELPISAAVRLLRDITDAIAAAHRHGVVHRDIKPDNVLLTENHAYVTDFGVAKAVSEATGRHQLTTAGVALGTPAYMAPEQAAADPMVDHRADIYALGVLAYEMVAGRTPFERGTAQATLAAHVMDVPRPVTESRAAVPPLLADLIMRCLAKKPADRWQTADEILARLETLSTPSGGTPPTMAVPATSAPTRRRIATAIPVVIGLVALGTVAVLSRGRGGGPPPDANVVAVLPFRVAGADPALHYLREGMIDLLAAKLTGEGAPRAADPRTVTSAWRRAVPSGQGDLDVPGAIALARGLGAGQVLLGGIVGAPGRVTFSASLLTVPGGTTRAQASVAGPADSLPVLVDALVSQLLVRGTSLSRRREASLTTGSVEALKAYLVGEGAYRRASYDTAAVHFERALGLDSSFALAAFGLIRTTGWAVNVRDEHRVRELAWSGRARLSERDRLMVEAYLGPRFPEPPFEAELLAARERVVGAVPDQAEAWYFLGDKYFHQGRYLGYGDWADRAGAAFERAIALDSTFAAPISHMVTVAAHRRDTAAVRRFGKLYLDAAERGASFDLAVRWDFVRTLGDSGLLREFWTAYDTSASRPGFLPLTALPTGNPGASDSMLGILARSASSQGERVFALMVRAMVTFNRGRPRDGLAAFDSARRLMGDPPFMSALEVLMALYWDVDSARGAQGVRRLAALVEAPLPDSGPRRVFHRDASCIREQWRVAHGQLGSVAATVARLRGAAAPRDDPYSVRASAICAALLEAMAAAAAHRPDASRLVERVDSIMRLGPQERGQLSITNLALGRLFEALGDPARGLAAVRRGGNFDNPAMISAYLLEEGRLAALTGDRVGAIRAYGQYLSMREDPEPEIRPEVERVKAELARLREGQ